jgi:hypothetical protein
MHDAEQPQPPLPLDAVVRTATAVTLRDGYHVPTLIAEGDRHSIVTQLRPLAPSSEERAQQLYALGAILAETGELGVLQQVFFITEAWLSLATPEHPPHFPPSQDPQRTEILVISRMGMQPPQTEAVIFEMQRNEEGALVNLENLDKQISPEQPGSAESPLLIAFAIGFLASWRDEED